MGRLERRKHEERPRGHALARWSGCVAGRGQGSGAAEEDEPGEWGPPVSEREGGRLVELVGSDQLVSVQVGVRLGFESGDVVRSSRLEWLG